MNPNLNPTPLEKLRHKKGWRLIQVKDELIKKGTPISYPTLLRIEHGFRTVVKRNKAGKKLTEEKKIYKPRIGYLMILAQLFKVKNPNELYEDRSKK